MKPGTTKKNAKYIARLKGAKGYVYFYTQSELDSYLNKNKKKLDALKKEEDKKKKESDKKKTKSQLAYEKATKKANTDFSKAVSSIKEKSGAERYFYTQKELDDYLGKHKAKSLSELKEKDSKTKSNKNEKKSITLQEYKKRYVDLDKKKISTGANKVHSMMSKRISLNRSISTINSVKSESNLQKIKRYTKRTR